MRAGFNPTRRNRNIGTATHGHGDDNRMAIPSVAASSRTWAETLGRHQRVVRMVASRPIVFIVEDLAPGCSHACSIDDLCHMLAHIPSADWRGLATFLLRQPTRKQRLLRPAWGRLFYDANLGKIAGPDISSGPALMLEAVEIEAPIKWPTSLQPDDLEELDRLRADGHAVDRVGRRYLISTTLESVRSTQLYRTFLHEIGHWVDYREKVVRPAAEDGADQQRLAEAYFQRASNERESFAFRYADKMGERLREFGVIPIARQPECDARLEILPST